MKGNHDDYLDAIIKYRYEGETSQGKINTLLDELLEKEEEITLYKSRLREVETAFYYNLELISERDLEISILEKRLTSEHETLEEVNRERDELEDLLKVVGEKNNRKIQELEARLSSKEEEIKNLERENLTKSSTVKRLLEDAKQQEKNLWKMNTKFEMQKNDLIKKYTEEIKKKENRHLLELDHLTGKLEQICKERDSLIKREVENQNLKHHLEEIKKQFLEKESHYLEQIRKLSNNYLRKISREIQCTIKAQEAEKQIQTKPDTSCQTSDSENDYVKRIKFLEEQNEVLKYIVKDLKRNQPRCEGVPRCECLALKAEIEKVKKTFETEINNLKKILEEEQEERAEEDAVILSLEAAVNCLKEKCLLGLQEKLSDFPGEDACTYTYNREIQTEIHVTLLEQKLNQKIDSLVITAEEERRNFHEKLENLKKECMGKMEKYLQLQLTPRQNENILENIRSDIQKLENKIETDMKNLLKNNSDKNKRDKNFQKMMEFPGSNPQQETPFEGNFCEVIREVLPVGLGLLAAREVHCGKRLSPEKSIDLMECSHVHDERRFRERRNVTVGS